MKKIGQKIIYSPSDLITFFNSPFASWMDRFYLENPKKINPDKPNKQAQFIIDLGNKHEQDILSEIEKQKITVSKIDNENINEAREKTRAALVNKTAVIYQAFLEHENFAGFADFIILDKDKYEVWDTKLAFSLKPTYIIQLCYYYEALKNIKNVPLSSKFGVIFGTKEREKYNVEDFYYFYKNLKREFLKRQDAFTGKIEDRPEPLRKADHGRWESYADAFFEETDHLTKIARISNSQIKKLKEVGVKTMRDVANLKSKENIAIDDEKLNKIINQARLQISSEEKKRSNPLASPDFVVLKEKDTESGLALLPKETSEDVFFDMEGYPLMHGGLEYLFGASVKNKHTGELDFYDWWAHSREEEKIALEEFIDWAYERWQRNKDMHIYHYAAYEVIAIRRLSTMHNTRQDEVDDLLRNGVFIDLYKIIKKGIMMGTGSYSIKDVELLYRQKRDTFVTSGSDSILQYAQWIASGESKDPQESKILSDIRSYNKDDCDSTAELVDFLRKIAKENGIETGKELEKKEEEGDKINLETNEELRERKEIEKTLYQENNDNSLFLANIIDFHRREEKSRWWRMFDLKESTDSELYDDMSCIAKIKITGDKVIEKQSYLQKYKFDHKQECKISNSNKNPMMFSDNLDVKFTIKYINTSDGELILKISKKKLEEHYGGVFPDKGSLIPYEHIPSAVMQSSLLKICKDYLEKNINKTTLAIINRDKIDDVENIKNVIGYKKLLKMVAGVENKCVVVQGPPGTGKTYTASHVIASLLKEDKKIGISSNSHKAIDNLLIAVSEVLKEEGQKLKGVRVSKENPNNTLKEDSALLFLDNSTPAKEKYMGGVITGTSWLFSRLEWENELDFLFIDEAGQVSLANIIAISPSAKNIILLGDQMQLKQPIQGSHPGDAKLSGLQYALKDEDNSTADKAVFYSVVPSSYGIFLDESRRMHPSVCKFISESIYDGKLSSYKDCVNQKIAVKKNDIINKENGVIFFNVEHEGNTRKSEEEALKIVEIYNELIGKKYTSKDKKTRPLVLQDFLFIAPYNAQVGVLQGKLPKGARVGTVDKFQGQEAPVCILSLCMSYGEERERGISFILDKNRINVAISRAQCLVVVVGDKRIANNYTNNIDGIKQINLFCKLINQ